MNEPSANSMYGFELSVDSLYSLANPSEDERAA